MPTPIARTTCARAFAAHPSSLIPLLVLGLAACADSTSPVDTDTAGGTTNATSYAVAALTCSEDAKLSGAYTTASALSALTADHEVLTDYVWDSTTAVPVSFDGSAISAGNNAAVSISGSTVTITKAGAYRLRGALSDGQVVVNTSDTGAVKLVLDGVSISRSADAAVSFAKSARAVVILASGSTNTLVDGSTYPSGADQNAALYAKGNLSIGGDGSLTVTGRYRHAITSKGGLVVRSGRIVATSVEDGIRGKTYLVVRGGTFTVNAGSDAFKGDKESTANAGYVLIAGGSGSLTAGNDGVQAETDLLATGGTYTIKTRGGSSAVIADTISAKALKAERVVVVDGGSFDIDAADDALHSNSRVVVNGGTITAATADDGIHADSALTVNGGSIAISKSNEGLESGYGDLTINGGRIRVVSSDDGVNLAGNGDAPPGSAAANYTLRITGGRLTVLASGDGLDANASVAMSGGCAFVHGPTANNNAPVDYDGGFVITGGILAAAGSAGMAQSPGSASTQASVHVTFSGTRSAGTVMQLTDASGNSLLDFAPSKTFQSLVISTPGLTRGGSYTLFSGGTVSGDAVDGVYESGRFTPGTSKLTYTQSAITTRVTY